MPNQTLTSTFTSHVPLGKEPNVSAFSQTTAFSVLSSSYHPRPFPDTRGGPVTTIHPLAVGGGLKVPKSMRSFPRWVAGW